MKCTNATKYTIYIEMHTQQNIPYILKCTHYKIYHIHLNAHTTKYTIYIEMHTQQNIAYILKCTHNKI